MSTKPRPQEYFASVFRERHFTFIVPGSGCAAGIRSTATWGRQKAVKIAIAGYAETGDFA